MEKRGYTRWSDLWCVSRSLSTSLPFAVVLTIPYGINADFSGAALSCVFVSVFVLLDMVEGSESTRRTRDKIEVVRSGVGGKAGDRQGSSHSSNATEINGMRYTNVTRTYERDSVRSLVIGNFEVKILSLYCTERWRH